MLYIYIYILCLYSSLQVHQFKSFPVPLSIRALYLPVLFPKKMVNPDNKVQLHHIRLRRCARTQCSNVLRWKCWRHPSPWTWNEGLFLACGWQGELAPWTTRIPGKLWSPPIQYLGKTAPPHPNPPPPPPPIVLFIVDESVQIRMRRFIVLFPQSSAILAF